MHFAHSILLLRVETRRAYNKQRFRALYYTWRTLSLEILLCITMNNKKITKARWFHLFIYTNGISAKICVFILFLVVEIFIGTIIILWEINSSTRKQCALRRNRQLFLHAHIMSTTENKKYDILLWMSRIESNIESVESSRTELWISKSKPNRIELNMEWIESNRIQSNQNCDFYTFFNLWYGPSLH